MGGRSGKRFDFFVRMSSSRTARRLLGFLPLRVVSWRTTCAKSWSVPVLLPLGANGDIRFDIGGDPSQPLASGGIGARVASCDSERGAEQPRTNSRRYDFSLEPQQALSARLCHIPRAPNAGAPLIHASSKTTP